MVARLSADDVAAEIRRRLPGLGTKKLHKLLYYCQGYHLAAFGQPLFAETVSAWDMGPVIGALWFRENDGEATTSGQSLEEADLNTVGYVLSRYGALTGTDLEHLTHQEGPWRDADSRRAPHGRETITLESMLEYFAAELDEDDEMAQVLRSGPAHHWATLADEARAASGSVDSLDEIRSRLAASA